MKRADIARDIAQSLFKAEDALDVAIHDFARLTSDLMEARSRMGLASTVGPQVVSRAAAVQVALAEARAEGAALHGALAKVKDSVGLRTVSVGAGDKMDDAVPEWPVGAAVHPSAQPADVRGPFAAAAATARKGLEWRGGGATASR